MMRPRTREGYLKILRYVRLRHLILLLDVVLFFDDYSVFELSVIAVSTILSFVVYFVKKKDISIYSALACYVILLISDSGMIQL